MSAPVKEGVDDSTPIPGLTSLAPSIFVPLEEDLTLPYVPPANKIDRLKQILVNLDSHSSRVRENLIFLFEREKARLTQEARHFEGNTPSPGLSPGEVESMIANMKATHDPSKPYCLDTSNLKPDFSDILLPEQTPREHYFRQIMKMVESAIGQLEGYALHTETVKGKYEKALQKETENETAFTTT